MPGSDPLRRQIIEGLTALQSDQAAVPADQLWAPLAAHITSIVGIDGFASLYARTVFLCQDTLPWLPDSSAAAQPGAWLEAMQASLQGQSPALASQANCLLLLTFTDLLASLVGEPLTARIVNSAWKHNTREQIERD